MNGRCNLKSGATLPKDNEVYYRIMRFHINSDVKELINKFKNDPNSMIKLEDIDVQEGFFDARRKLKNGSYERGKSVNWADCTTPELTAKNHNTRHQETDFGILSIKVESIHKIIFNSNSLRCEYNPIPKIIAHSLIIGFPTKEEADAELALEFLTLKQIMSEISQWVLFPEFID